MSRSLLLLRSFLLLALSICVAGDVSPSSSYNYTLQSADGDWMVSIRPWKGSLAALYPNTSDAFSFINNDSAGNFSSIPSHHSHGDLTVRVKTPSEATYRMYSTANAYQNRSALLIGNDSSTGMPAFDVTPLMRPGHGLRVIKRWGTTTVPRLSSPALTLTVELQNNGSDVLVLGALGVSALFSSNWNNFNLAQAAERCSLAEPSIAGEHGWVKVTRLTGVGRVLLMSPLPSARARSGLRAWRQLKQEDSTPAGYAFEGHYEWTALTSAWADDWHQPYPWTDTPEPVTLAAGESVTFAWMYQLVKDVRSVDQALTAQGEFSAVAVPGYVLSTDMSTARLYVAPPAGTSVVAIQQSGSGRATVTPSSAKTSAPYLAYDIAPTDTGRVRLALRFTSTTANSTAFVHLFVLPPLAGHLSRVGSFSAANQWYTNTSDPFGRASSIMPYDFESRTITVQDERSYVVGLSDEAGAGPGLAFAMANRYRPVPSQVELLDTYINKTLLGVKGGDGGPVPFRTSVQNANYSVRASMFWYPGMPNYRYTVRSGWDQGRGAQLWRSYNYVHPTVHYHTMYRICRDFDRIPRLYPCDWYLTSALSTFNAMFDNAPYYTQFGLMEGSVFLDVIADLQLEGRQSDSTSMNAAQARRVQTWKRLPFPFGSEMPWDSTGQEEIWLSAQAMGEYGLSNSSLSAILAYAHAIPNWAYHGSARRFWDFWINGKPNYTQSWPERNLHHYGSSLNGKPLLRAYEINPDDLYTLQVGIGAMTGVLSNIQSDGATSMGFHADNALLKHDPFDADYGCALYGHVTSASAYFVQHPQFGPSCYLCDYMELSSGAIELQLRDSLQRRVYLEPIGSSVEVEAGRILSVVLDMTANTVNVTLDGSAVFSQHRVKLVHWARCDARPGCGLRITSPKVQEVRGAWTFPAGTASVVVTMSWAPQETVSILQRLARLLGLD